MEELYCLPGFGFHPTDAQLVLFYLKGKVLGKMPGLNVIPEIDLYKFEPGDLSVNPCWKTRDRFYFCHLDRKYAIGKRNSRTTEKGFWKTTGNDKTIEYKSNIVGIRKTLCYHLGKAPCGTPTGWQMYEYRLRDKRIPQDSLVLCKIFDKNAPLEEEDLDSDCDNADDENGPLIPHSDAAQITPPERDDRNTVSILGTTKSSCEHESILEPSIQECGSSVSQLPCSPIGFDECIDVNEFLEYLEEGENPMPEVGGNCKVDSTVPDDSNIGGMQNHEADDENGPLIPHSDAAQITPPERDDRNTVSILGTTKSSCEHESILEPSIQECGSSVSQLPCSPIDFDGCIDVNKFLEYLEEGENPTPEVGGNCKVDSTVPDDSNVGGMHNHEMTMALGKDSCHLPLNSTELLNSQRHPECVHVENKIFSEFSGGTYLESDDLRDALMCWDSDMELNDFMHLMDAGSEYARSDSLLDHQWASNWSADMQGINVAGRNNFDMSTRLRQKRSSACLPAILQNPAKTSYVTSDMQCRKRCRYRK